MPTTRPARLTRRQLLTAAAVPVLGGCGFVPQRGEANGDPHTLTFTTWGTAAELTGLRRAVAGFEARHRGRHVVLNAVPYKQMFPNLDAQIQAGDAPDIFRVPYGMLGAYAGRGQLLNVESRLPADFGRRFTPAAWAAVQGRGHAVGVPHHTDTSVILFNRAMLRRAGVRQTPTRIEQAWTWSQFASVARALRANLPSAQYPLAVNWQGASVTRWLSWLWENDGRLLSADRQRPAIDSPAAREAVGYTQSFFGQGWVPANDSVKSAALAADTWLAQTAAMTFAGAFELPDAAATATFDWGATFAPRQKRSASDFGGNAVVASAHTTKPDLVASFLDYLTRRQVMLDFCVTASLLPTRRDLVERGITFTIRPELSGIFTGQARTVRAADVAQVASPSMSAIVPVLQDGLEKAFVGGVDAADTTARLAAGIHRALSS